MKCDVAIIGGGPAGLAAAAAAKERAPEARVVVIEREDAPGGILKQCIHNGFGLHFFGEELTGPEYAQRFVDRALKAGVELLTDAMVLSLSPDRVITAVGEKCGLIKLEAKAVVLAMGCRERTRGALNIPGDRPAGIYTAGCAQRLVNMEGYMPGRRVVILGSGDIGLIMARRLTWEGAKVELVAELMPYSSGLNRNIVQCLSDNGIPLKFNHTVTKIRGRERVEAVVVAEVDPLTRAPIAGSETEIPCDTLLLSVGLIPENELTLGAGIALDPVTSGAIVDERRETSAEGVFACGNVLHVHDLVDNVSAEAIIAGEAAADYALRGEDKREYVNLRGVSGVRYTVPQRARRGDGKLDVYFRVGKAYKGAELVVRRDGEEIIRRKKNVMTPGEMEKLTLDRALVTGDIELSVEEARA